MTYINWWAQLAEKVIDLSRLQSCACWQNFTEFFQQVVFNLFPGISLSCLVYSVIVGLLPMPFCKDLLGYHLKNRKQTDQANHKPCQTVVYSGLLRSSSIYTQGSKCFCKCVHYLESYQGIPSHSWLLMLKSAFKYTVHTVLCAHTQRLWTHITVKGSWSKGDCENLMPLAE